MLSRIATRAILNGRSSPSAFRTAVATTPAQFLRWKSSRSDPPHGRAKPRDNDVRGPVSNQTWGADLGGKSQSRGAPSEEEEGQEDSISRQPEFGTAAQPSSSRAEAQKRANSSTEADPPGDAFIHEPETNYQAREHVGQEPQQPQKPLPDLTKGIPSTLESELSEVSPSFKDKDAEPPSPNIIDDPNSSEPEPGSSRGQGGQGSKEEYISSIDRRRNRVANILYLGAALIITGTGLWAGRPWPTEKEEIAHHDAPNGYSPKATWKRIQSRFASSFGSYMEPVVPELLPTMPPDQRMPYTLVLSLEDLLVHSKWTRQKGWEVAKRPGVDYFLRYLASYYELVIFTSVASMNADMVIRKLDPYRIVQFPLYREHTRYVGGEIVKDLSYLNRDLSKVIIVDTVPSHVKLHPDNAIILPKWSGMAQDPHAKDLVGLIPFLEFVATMNVPDVRRTIQSFEGKSVPEEFAIREQRMREAFKKQQAEKGGPKKSSSSPLSGLAKSLGISSDAGRMPGDPMAVSGGGDKMLLDQYRERGIQQYRMLDQEIKERGEAFLKEIEAEEKKMIDESMKGVQSGVQDFLSSWIPFGGKKQDEGEKKEDGKK